jgi:hypothetical protein
MAGSEMQRIMELEKALIPFAKLGGPLGYQTGREDSSVVLTTLAEMVTVGDFRRAAAVLSAARSIGAQDG